MRKAASVGDYRALAQARLPHFLFEYLDGGSYDEVTLAANVGDLREVKLRQRVLRNHGTLAVGKNVGECFIRLYYLERACQAQIMALSAGDQINRPPQGAPEITADQGAVGLPLAANLLAWPALKRKAYRLDPNFAT